MPTVDEMCRHWNRASLHRLPLAPAFVFIGILTLQLTRTLTLALTLTLYLTHTRTLIRTMYTTLHVSHVGTVGCMFMLQAGSGV